MSSPPSLFLPHAEHLGEATAYDVYLQTPSEAGGVAQSQREKFHVVTVQWEETLGRTSKSFKLGKHEKERIILIFVISLVALLCSVSG